MLFAKQNIRIPKVENISFPLTQAQHAVLVSGGIKLSQDKNSDIKKQAVDLWLGMLFY